MALDPSINKTGAAVPSDKPLDIQDDSLVFDTMINDTSGQTVLDRKGVERETYQSAINRINNDANEVIDSYRQRWIGDYVLPNKVFRGKGDFVTWAQGDGGDGNAYVYVGPESGLPYFTDVDLYPDPNSDPNLQVNPTVTALYVQQQASSGDSGVVGGLIWPLDRTQFLSLGAQSTTVTYDATRFNVNTGSEVELLYLWEPGGTLPASPFEIQNIVANNFNGYTLTVDGSDYEILPEGFLILRLNNDIVGWAPSFDGTTDITNSILEAKSYVETTNNRDLICSKGNGYINGTIELDNQVNVSFGSNKVISGPTMQWVVRKGSAITIDDVRMGEDGLTQNTIPLFLVNSEAGPIFLDGQRDTAIKTGIRSEILVGAPFVRLEAKVQPGQVGSSAVTGIDVDIKTNQGRRAVEINVDNLEDTAINAFVNSCRIKLNASATINGIYEIYNSNESITTKPLNCEIAQNNYFIEYQSTSGEVQIPLNSLGDRHVIDGQIWDLNIASNLSNVRVRGDACNILSSSFPTEESGRLVLGDGITPNTLGGLGGTQRSRVYSSIAARTHCKYLGTGRTTNDLINATYAFLVSAADAIISGTDYSDGTIINSKTFPPAQFILNGDISVDYKMIGVPTVGDKFGLGIRINGTTYSTLRSSGLTSDGFISHLTLYMSVAENRIDIAYKIGTDEKVLVSQSVPDLSVNGATIEVYGFSHEGGEPANRVTIAGLDGLIKYKTA